MSSPTPRDVKRMLESMADQEPPEGLLDRLDATVPEALPTVARPDTRVASWSGRRVLVATLGLAAALAMGMGLAGLLGTWPRSFVTTATVPTPAQPVATPPHLPTPASLPATLPGPTVARPSPRFQVEHGETDGVAEPSAPAVSPDTVAQLNETLMVKPGETTRLDVVMKPAPVAEEITVTGSYQTISPPGQGLAMDEKPPVAGLPVGRDLPPVTGLHGYVPAAPAHARPGGRTDPSGRSFEARVVGTTDELLVIDSRQPRGGEAPASASGARTALQGRKRNGEPAGEMPLRHTGVTADIAGFMARTVVTQEYVNTFTEPIEAVYVFPLGAMAAVNDFVMEVGERRIVGIVRPRQEAERIYQQARERGQTATLLTQERPNIFTQNVANIAPGGTVTITITTFETLAHDRGTFEYVFPMVVGPRYIPGGAVAAAPRAVGGGGWSPATTVLPDADRITPPVLKPGERSGHDIDLTVHLDAGLPITEVRSVAHTVDISGDGATRRTIKLVEADAIPNRDFVLRWTVAGERLQTGVLTHRDHGEGYLALLVQPPLDPADALVSAREITFVLDVSGSMSGVPVETSKALVRRVLDSLRPADAFNIFVFASGNGQLWDEPRGSSPENVAAAREFLTSLQGSGGTEMLAGLRRAITGTHDPARLQMFVFCTDGFVGDEERILAFIQQERKDARFFAFGIGSSVNRYLIDGVGRLGGGASMVVLPREAGAADRAAERFFSLIDAAVLVDAAMDWNGLPVTDSYPERLGDLFAGGAFTVIARYTGRASGVAYLTGRLGTKTVRFPIVLELPRRAREHPELAPVWARRRIADLSEAVRTAPEDQAATLKQAITDLAMEYRLASPFTSFVAVDEAEVRGTGRPKRVHQPVPMPQDVRYEGVFGKPR